MRKVIILKRVVLVLLLALLGALVVSRYQAEQQLTELRQQQSRVAAVRQAVEQLERERQEAEQQAAENIAKSKPESPEPTATPEPEEPEIVFPDFSAEATYIANTIQGEAGGCSIEQQAAVAWCILNRVDADGYGSTVKAVVTAPHQFEGYYQGRTPRQDLYNLAIDVLQRWYLEKQGVEDVGRVLPKEYTFFTGDGKVNWYVTTWKGSDYWDWSLPSPYEEVS